MKSGNDWFYQASGRTAKEVLTGFACLLGAVAILGGVYFLGLNMSSTIARMAVVAPVGALIIVGLMKALPRRISIPLKRPE
jgi:membrane protein YdbS with pleckstrin-like domain